MERTNKKVITWNIPLVIWFFLDMTGFHIGTNLLVSQSYKEDGIFFLLYLIALTTFVGLNGKWKFILPTFLSFWFLIQLYSHWYFTIFGPWEGKNRYFLNTIKLIPSKERYIPDFYHIVLHTLILTALIATIFYWKRELMEETKR